MYAGRTRILFNSQTLIIMRYVYIITLFSLIGFSTNAQQVAKSTYGDVILTSATVHTITNGTLENTDVHIKDGKILAVGTSLSVEGAERIDCRGKHIYPGFIDGGTRLGLSEVGAVSLTNDFNEIGEVTPQMKALTAVNPNAVAIPVTRVNGVTTVIAAPSGGIFSGTASLINLHGYTPAQMDAGFHGIVMNFPTAARRSRFDRRSDEDIKKAQEKATA